MSDHNREALQTHILSLSNSDNWNDARQEWLFSGAMYHHTFTNCPCGVQIKEMCYVHNIENDNDTYIGNVCINNFMGMDVDTKIWSGIKRITADIEANANSALVHYCYQMEILRDNEYKFLLDTCLDRKFTEKQLNWKRILNRKILRELVK